MKIIHTSVEEMAMRRLLIGFEGENQRATVRIDCASVFAEYPNATPALIVKPLFADAYPVVVDRDGTDVVWLITSEILSFSGDGEIQLVFYKDEVICKSAVSKIRVCRSLQVTGDMPDPVAQWVDDANRKLAEVDAQIVELEGMVDTATDAATRAEQSASTASAKAEQAAGSAATATEKATEATNAAGTATAKAAEAEQSALTATDKANAAAESERIATAKAGDATTAAGTATAKAEQATEAAQTATEKAGDASASARAAHVSEISAAESADDALAAQTAAKASETAASTSATQAAQSAQGASADAQTAMQKAAEASQSATNAATSAETASTKAGEAAASAQAASDAKTAVEQTAEQLADSLEQIAQNTQDIAELDERKANVDGYYPDMTVGNAEQLNSSKYVENSEPYTLRTSGGSSDIGNREYLDAVVGGTVAWNQMVRDEASENSTDFAPIVTVTDAVEDAAGVKVQIEPVQDLHGYDSPWPGGSGKNLAQITAETIVKPSWYTGGWDGTTVNSNGGITQTRTYQQGGAGGFVLELPEGAYMFSMEFTGTTQNCMLYVSSWDGTTMTTILANERMNKNGNRYYFGFTVPSGSIQLVARPTIWSGNLTYDLNKIQVESGSSTPTAYEPYSNICPISGWNQVEITRSGGNLLPTYTESVTQNGITYTANADGSVTVNGTATATNTYTAPLGTWTWDGAQDVWLSGCPTGGNYYNGYSLRLDAEDSNWSNPDIGNGIKLAGFSDSNAIVGKKLKFCIVVRNGTVCNNLVFKPMLNFGNSALPYEEYKGLQTYSITLPTEAGTVYSGTLTVNANGSGSLVVDRARAKVSDLTANGGLIVGTYTAMRRFFLPSLTVAVAYNQKHGAIGSMGVEAAAYYGANRTSDAGSADVDFGITASGDLLAIYDTDLTLTSDTFMEKYGDAVIVYPLAAPITYALSPTEIRTLLGENNVWADTGDLALTYTGTDEHLTLESGKKYLSRISGTDSMLLGSGQEITAAKGTDNVFDLTQMFGTAVADYVYGQGAGFFRKWFGKTRYPYNAGELLSVEGLQSHDMVGFNQWDEEWEVGGISITNGQNIAANSRIRSKNYIKCLPGTAYYMKGNFTNGVTFFDENKVFLGRDFNQYPLNSIITTPSNASYMRFSCGIAYGTTYKHDICINLAHNNSRNGEYEPYERHSYPLDSSVILRGIPKVGANGVYWDGDRYLPDGTVERRYGVVDLGTLNWSNYNADNHYFRNSNNPVPFKRNISNVICSKYPYIGGAGTSATTLKDKSLYIDWNTDGRLLICDTAYSNSAEFKAAMSGVLLVYELATPTTETAQPYHSTQWVSDWGTEEFVSTGIIPVGTETRYPANLRDKLQHLPDAASGNGSYLITQTDGQMVLTPFPAPPSTAGNYVLKATVVNGVATYTWEVAT